MRAPTGTAIQYTVTFSYNVVGARIARPSNSLSHGCAVPDLRRSACLSPAQRAASSTPSKRELQFVDISKLGLNSKIKKFSYSFICGKGYSPPFGGE